MAASWTGAVSSDATLHYQDKKADPAWYVQITRASDAGILTEEQMERYRIEMGSSAYLREFECDASAPVEHSVIGDLINHAQAEGRIVDLPHQPMADVGCAWDLGIRDSTSIWLYQQAEGHVHVIAYREFAGLGLVDIIHRLRKDYPSYQWGDMVLPHDVQVRDYSSGLSRLSTFIDMDFGSTYPLKRIPVEDGLNATRINLSRCVFDKTGCERGLTHLKNACYEVDAKTGTIQNRVRHDDASHALDAFRYLCTHLEERNPTARSQSFRHRGRGPDYSDWSVPIN